MPKNDTPRSTLTHIGGWKLGKTLGRGAYAHVRLATHPNGHKAACKILPALHHTPGREVSWDETIDAVEAHKEVVLLRGLSGAGVPGIVGLEGVMEDGGWTYVFLTLYPASASAYSTPWNQHHFIPFFRRLLQTIDILHQLNISHEDLKRSNVLVDEYGLPAVVDFGFSHFRPDGGKVRSAGGTLDYSSPQKAADHLYDPKPNDVWSLGILAMKLLGIPHPFTRHRPQEESSAIKQRIIEGRARFRFGSDDSLPGGIAEVIMGMLELEPEKRWTISQVLQHPSLQPFQAEPRPFSLPSGDLSYMHKVDPSVVDDLCFLAYLNNHFYLCESPLKIIQRLQGEHPCWEKTWASFLAAWSKRAEMDWEDIPKTITPLRTRSLPAARSDKVEPIPRGPLKEIHLTPENVKTPVPAQATGGVNGKHQKENLPPKQPRKSRIYGMKTRGESSRNVLGEVDRQESHEQQKVPKIKKNNLNVYHNETSAPPYSTATILVNKVSSNTETTLASSAVAGSTSENAIIVDSSYPTRAQERETPKATRAKKAAKGKGPKRGKENETANANRNNGRGKASESGTAHAGEQMKGLDLAANQPRGPRRRSPRFEGRDKEQVAWKA
ncbi:CAMK/CAMKL protein kinase [Kwoniella mangroviensis CBS 10435]|uniref:CAMK/CAMKL protein kinase n=1 Tax=Kwoniella mangroviensis CBS 10435 TaxID=1331196 RepID=A0A1B9IR41_9TREE|nr:CAMK/CAMKL protein kinase [Kwoniella mangroviensis CBS 10435]